MEKVIIGEGSGDHQVDRALSIEDALDKLIAEAEALIATAEKDTGAAAEASKPAVEEEETLTDILPGFPEKVEGEIVFWYASTLICSRAILTHIATPTTSTLTVYIPVSSLITCLST